MSALGERLAAPTAAVGGPPASVDLAEGAGSGELFARASAAAGVAVLSSCECASRNRFALFDSRTLAWSLEHFAHEGEGRQPRPGPRCAIARSALLRHFCCCDLTAGGGFRR